jgi:hypothetical protein
MRQQVIWARASMILAAASRLGGVLPRFFTFFGARFLLFATPTPFAMHLDP